MKNTKQSSYQGPPIPRQHLSRINMNGLSGRMVYIPSSNKSRSKEILLVYGHHSSLERLYALANVLSDYGSVTMPDMPGFGGMDSLYKINEKPDLDTMADYLASFVKMRFKDRPIVIAGVSYGFLVVTRMLQRYPEMQAQVILLVSVVGFMHYEDFAFSRKRRYFYLSFGRLLSFFALPPKLFRATLLHPYVLRTLYSRTNNAKHKFANLSAVERQEITEFEVHLWRCNDVRTYLYTAQDFLSVDNTKIQIGLPVWHVSVPEDHYFNNVSVEGHMRKVFKKYIQTTAPVDRHMPHITAGKEESSYLIPDSLKKELAKKPPVQKLKQRPKRRNLTVTKKQPKTYNKK